MSLCQKNLWVEKPPERFGGNEVRMSVFHLGLIINPLAGLGGPAGLKGSDGVAAEALARGALPRAAERTRVALELLLPLRERLHFLTFPGPKGGDLLAEMGFRHRLLGELNGGE